MSLAVSFLSPVPASRKPNAHLTPVPSSAQKTPYKKDDHPLPFLSPLVLRKQKRMCFDAQVQEAYESFLCNAYFLEFKSRKKVYAEKGKEADQDAVLEEVEKTVGERIRKYKSDELIQIRQFYRMYAQDIGQMMRYLNDCTTQDLDDLIKMTVENLKPLKGKKLDSNLVESCIASAAAQLERFSNHFQLMIAHENDLANDALRPNDQKIIARKNIYHSDPAWIIYLSLLGLAIGASLHFIPLVGAAIAMPVAIHWLFLLVNVLVPSLSLGVMGGMLVYGQQKALLPYKANKIVLMKEKQYKEGVERLLVQVTQRLLIETGQAERTEVAEEEAATLAAQPNFMSS